MMIKNNKGAILILMAILLPLCIGIFAFVLNVGLLMVERNRVQNIADAIALGACGGLYHDNMPWPESTNTEQISITVEALRVANDANATAIATYGHWHDGFVPGGSVQVPLTWPVAVSDFYNVSGFVQAVEVTVTKDVYFFLFGTKTVSANAIAAVRYYDNCGLLDLTDGCALVE